MHIHLDLTGIIIISPIDIELWAVENRNKVIRMISDSTYFAYLIHIIILHYVIKISDEMIFKSVATIIISIITGILYNYIKKILDEFYKRHGTERG